MNSPLKTAFQVHGTSWVPANNQNLVVQPLLPPASFIVKRNPQTGQYYLDQTESFTVPSKMYGNVPNRADRIMQTFLDRPYQTGVLMTGEKGSGKSMMAKLLCIKAAELGHPTIIVNQPWTGDGFMQLIQAITQPAVILFDEFEKVYHERNDQQELLTMFDGTIQSKKLFVVTCNDVYKIDTHMMNRPGRMFYKLTYTGLDEAFIREYCDDNLEANNPSNVDAIVGLSNLFDADRTAFNFDMLKALVEEMNRYRESTKEALQLLNISPADNLAQHNYRLS